MPVCNGVVKFKKTLFRYIFFFQVRPEHSGRAGGTLHKGTEGNMIQVARK
jgi:hypothetical protein